MTTQPSEKEQQQKNKCQPTIAVQPAKQQESVTMGGA
jgi:hypothetical protein